MIDDNPMAHMVMQHMFDHYELFRDAAHSLDGGVILEFLRNHRLEPELLPDIILLDLYMPEYSGWLFLEEFRLLQPLLKKNISVYILSASTDKLDILRSTSYTFVNDYFSKPMSEQQLELLYLNYTSEHRIAG
jgi:CheY-like chemotaxis protein